MTQDQRRILQFCISEWRHLTSLETEIPRSTLYRLAKGLCGKNWLVHRRTKGYKVTQRGIKALGKDKIRTEESEEKIDSARVEQERPSKRSRVNLSAIQKLLGLSEEMVNRFFLLYPPLKEVPTPTHQAIIELVWAEMSNRSWPVRDDHHLSFLNFGATFTWKTNSAKFCAHMVADGETTPYILPLSGEGGCSLWVRKTSTGKIIFKRKILEKSYICLDDYHRADRDGKRAAAHLLTGQMQIPVENEIQTIRCVSMINLNPQKGKTVFEKTGFDEPLIRRFIPCNLDAIELPNLKDIGQKALDSAAAFGPLEMKEPTSDCTEYRKELINYFEELFTEGGQRYIDVEGLLNIARGFTGYGFTASEAIRYTFYQASLPYHTLGWLRAKWIQGFREKKTVAKIEKMLTPEVKTDQEPIQIPMKIDKKDFETLQDSIRFQEEYEDELSRLKKLATEIEEIKEFLEQKELNWERIDQILLEEGSKVPSPKTCENAFQQVNKKYGNIQQRDWASLENLKKANKWLNETYIEPLRDSKRRIKTKLESWNQIQDCISNVRKVNQIPFIREMIDRSPLVPSQKHMLEERIDEKKTALEQQRQRKITKLVGYLREMKELGNSMEYETMRKQARDITEDLLELEVIKKENNQLRGKDGQIYTLDMFNLAKYADTYDITFGWNPACRRALTLLTGVEDKALAVNRKFAQDVSEFSVKWITDERHRQQKTLEADAMQENVVLDRWLTEAYEKAKRYFSNRKKAQLEQRQIQDLLSTGCYIQTKGALIPVELIGKEDNWLVFQLRDGRIWHLPHNRTSVTILLKPEYGAHTYQFIRQEGLNLIVRVNRKDEKIPINQVRKVIYREESKN